MSIKLNGGGALPNKLLQSKDFGFIGVDVGVMYNFGNNNLWNKAELVRDVWITHDIATGIAKGAYSWAMPCKPNTTYIVTRESKTNRGKVGSSVKYPDGNGGIETIVEIVNNTCTITTGSNSKYLVIFFAAYEEKYINVKWTVKEVK